MAEINSAGMQEIQLYTHKYGSVHSQDTLE